jgi:hypothetical protein
MHSMTKYILYANAKQCYIMLWNAGDWLCFFFRLRSACTCSLARVLLAFDAVHYKVGWIRGWGHVSTSAPVVEQGSHLRLSPQKDVSSWVCSWPAQVPSLSWLDIFSRSSDHGVSAH